MQGGADSETRSWRLLVGPAAWGPCVRPRTMHPDNSSKEIFRARSGDQHSHPQGTLSVPAHACRPQRSLDRPEGDTVLRALRGSRDQVMADLRSQVCVRVPELSCLLEETFIHPRRSGEGRYVPKELSAFFLVGI